MPERLIGRRVLLGTAFKSVLGTTIGQGAAQLDSGLKRFSLTNLPPAFVQTYSEVLPHLNSLSSEVAPRIHFSGFNESSRPRIIPRSEIFAKAIIRMAYLDGGYPEAEMVADTIEDIGISVIVEELPPGSLGVTRTKFSDPQNPNKITSLEIGIDQGAVTAEGTYFHELFHLVQVTRAPKAIRTAHFSSPLVSSAFPLGVATLFGFWDIYKNRDRLYSKSHLLSSFLLSSTSGGVSSWLGVRLGYFLQAKDPLHYQLDQRLELFSVHPLIRELKGNLWVLEEPIN